MYMHDMDAWWMNLFIYINICIHFTCDCDNNNIDILLCVLDGLKGMTKNRCGRTEWLFRLGAPHA